MQPIPPSMADELGSWNAGHGIDLESWAGCAGNFRLAVGYAAVFWPRFVLLEGYILREGVTLAALRDWEVCYPGNRPGIEAILNHLHLADIQHGGCEDISADKLLLLGRTLEEIHQAKLKWQFPDRRFTVSFFVPDDETDLMAYQLTFWQEPAARGAS